MAFVRHCPVQTKKIDQQQRKQDLQQAAELELKMIRSKKGRNKMVWISLSCAMWDITNNIKKTGCNKGSRRAFPEKVRIISEI